MSGVLGGIATILLRPAPLSIGGMILLGHEVPGRISIGGANALTIHKLPGGDRIIDVMGADEGTISWRAVFAGPLAALRARMLDAMRRSGLPQLLSFGDYSFTVLVSHFEYDYRDQGAVIAYRIRAEIVDGSDAAPTLAGTLQQAIASDLGIAGNVLSAVIGPVLAYAGAGTGGAPVAVAAAGQFAAIGTSLAATAAMADAGTLATVSGNAPVASGLLAAATELAAATASVSVGALTAPATGIGFANGQALADATAQAGLLAAAARSGGYINRANTNLDASTARSAAPLLTA